jgi:hypothetical protein
MRFEKHPWRAVVELPGRQVRERIDPRRLNYARRAIARQQDRAGLFAEPIDVNEVALLRLTRIRDQDEESLRRERDRRAAHWRVVRRALHALPDDVREVVLHRWNTAGGPAVPEYFASMLWGTCHPEACAILALMRDDLAISLDLLRASPALRAAMERELAALGRVVAPYKASR